MEYTSGQRRGAFETSGKSFAGSMRRVCAISLLLTVVACSSSSTLGRESTPSPSPNLITANEISKTSVQNALEAVQKLRPAMLRRATISSANAQSRGDIVIYVDNTRYGAVDTLRQIPSSSIAVVRYFSASESQLKWGSGHPGGVIEVVTKR
jgi:hypothetical protein